MPPIWERPVEGPSTHALIIGVGAYPNLAGAKDPILKALKPISSPAASALALAELLTSDAYLEAHPNLASVHLLVSGGSALPDRWQPAQIPTRSAIEQAFDEWAALGDRDRNNQLIFYFCGHGLQKSELILLPDDIGANPHRPFANAIAISQTRLGMYKVAARSQLWLVDACREARPQLLAKLGAVGSPLREPEAVSTAGLDSTFLASTTDFEQAAGLSNAPSYFAEALISALRGAASSNDGERWQVSSGALQNAINAHLELRLAGVRGAQRCESLGGTGRSVLARYASPPEVDVEVGCVPVEHLARVKVELRQGLATITAERDGRAWRTRVVAGVWDVEANPQADGHPNPQRKVAQVFGPPVGRAVLRW